MHTPEFPYKGKENQVVENEELLRSMSEFIQESDPVNEADAEVLARKFIDITGKLEECLAVFDFDHLSKKITLDETELNQLSDIINFVENKVLPQLSDQDIVGEVLGAIAQAENFKTSGWEIVEGHDAVKGLDDLTN